ncbi:MAG: hypothetical protein Kow00127_20050 [Bacteroidales bacterium]
MISGLVAGGLIIFLIDKWIAVQLADYQQMGIPGPEDAGFEYFPVRVYLYVLLSRAAGAFAGSAVAAFIARVNEYRIGAIISLILLLSGAVNYFIISHPGWFLVLVPFAYFIPGLMAAFLIRKFKSFSSNKTDEE